MESHAPSISTHRDGRLVVCRFGSDAVHAANRTIKDAFRQRLPANPTASPIPLFTDVASVQDRGAKALHLILVRGLDYRPRGASAAGNVAVFSKPAYAPFRTTRLQLATPAYYRDQEDLAPGIGDAHDGTLTKDSIEWARTVVPVGMVTNASISFAASREPWVYCASHYRLDRELRRLRDDFAEKYGYTAVTGIVDPAAFALWLGIDFALDLDKATDVTLGMLDEFCYAQSRYNPTLGPDSSGRFETIVQVCHGLVHYEDRSGHIATQEDWLDLHGAPRAWFTKRTCLASQREYRFTVSTLGDPVDPRHYIDVSPELRELTFAL